MIDLDSFEMRELQKQSARALACMEANNNNISQFNKEAHHNSQNWYKAVIRWYINQYGGLPSDIGPGKDIKLIMDN